LIAVRLSWESEASLQIEQTGIQGLLVLKPAVFADRRGYFFESWNESRFCQAGLDMVFRQDNISCSVRNVLRGLHFTREHPQGQLVGVLAGSIFDVVVDLRGGSPTFGRWCGRTMTADQHEQLWMPPGFAHGFCTLSPEAIVSYKCTQEYRAGDEGGLHWRDAGLAIPWPAEFPAVSDRDNAFPCLNELAMDGLPRVRFEAG
jgi:dTDP-4-dehydrorhamnose 3,5-epimerase